MHPEDSDAQPTVRRHPSLAPDGETDLNWAYDTPLGAPRRGLDADPVPTTPLPSGTVIRETSTISPLIHARRDTPPGTPMPSTEDPWEHLGVGVFMVGVGTLSLAALLALTGGVLLLLG